ERAIDRDEEIRADLAVAGHFPQGAQRFAKRRQEGPIDNIELDQELPHEQDDRDGQIVPGGTQRGRADAVSQPPARRDGHGLHTLLAPAWRRTESQTSLRNRLKSSLSTVISRSQVRSMVTANSCTIRPGRCDITSTRSDK